MIKFEKVKKFENIEFNLPIRKTENSAGYDFEVAEDITIPSIWDLRKQMSGVPTGLPKTPTLSEVARYTKTSGIRPTLVPTGVKCYLDKGYYLELSVRSSSPLKYWLVCANSVGRL